MPQNGHLRLHCSLFAVAHHHRDLAAVPLSIVPPPPLPITITLQSPSSIKLLPLCHCQSPPPPSVAIAMPHIDIAMSCYHPFCHCRHCCYPIRVLPPPLPSPIAAATIHGNRNHDCTIVLLSIVPPLLLPLVIVPPQLPSDTRRRPLLPPLLIAIEPPSRHPLHCCSRRPLQLHCHCATLRHLLMHRCPSHRASWL